MPLYWRVFAVNATVLTVAAVGLAVSPLTVSFPVALTELVVLAAGLAALLAANLALLRGAFGPLSRLTAFMRDVDPLRPGGRAPVERGDSEVADLTRAFNEMIGRVETERRDSARRALAAQEEERRRISLELHDEVGQALTAVMLQLERAEVGAAKEGVRSTLEELREIAARLRPGALDDLGLASALRELAAVTSRATRIDIAPVIDRELPNLAPDTELVLYRVCQEALTNVSRHARAATVELSLVVRTGRLVLTVEDDGRGFDTSTALAGSGIRGMRERALLVGRSLEVDSARGRGTRLRLEVPT